MCDEVQQHRNHMMRQPALTHCFLQALIHPQSLQGRHTELMVNDKAGGGVVYYYSR